MKVYFQSRYGEFSLDLFSYSSCYTHGLVSHLMCNFFVALFFLIFLFFFLFPSTILCPKAVIQGFLFFLMFSEARYWEFSQMSLCSPFLKSASNEDCKHSPDSSCLYWSRTTALQNFQTITAVDEACTWWKSAEEKSDLPLFLLLLHQIRRVQRHFFQFKHFKDLVGEMNLGNLVWEGNRASCSITSLAHSSILTGMPGDPCKFYFVFFFFLHTCSIFQLPAVISVVNILWTSKLSAFWHPMRLDRPGFFSWGRGSMNSHTIAGYWKFVCFSLPSFTSAPVCF